jgi:hypothetical protein
MGPAMAMRRSLESAESALTGHQNDQPHNAATGAFAGSPSWLVVPSASSSESRCAAR